MKQTIELTIPDGYEVAEGEQPRLPKKGDCYLHYDGKAVEVLHDFQSNRHIILKKKAPEYKTSKNSCLQTAESLQWVEIKALEDAVRIIKHRASNLNTDQIYTVNALKELLK